MVPCNHKMDSKEEKKIINFVEDFILNDPYFDTLSKKEQQSVRNTFIVVMRAVYKAANYPNVIPVIYCHDYQSAELIRDAMAKVATFMPNVDKIKLHITH